MPEKPSKIPILALFIPFGMVSLSTGATFFSPVYPTILNEYATYSLMVPLTISLFLMGKALSGLLYGILSDAYGRRVIMFLGMGLFVLGSLIGAFDPGIELLIFSRFIQGAGSSVATVVGIATINDLYQGKTAARVTSRAGNIHIIISSLLPIAAGYIAAYTVWQYNFIVMFILSVLALWIYWRFVPESLPIERRTKIDFHELKESFQNLVKDTNYRIFVSLDVLTNFGVQCFYAVSPVVFIKYLNVPVEHYAYYVLIGSAAFVVGSLISRLLIRRLSIVTIIRMGMVLYTLGGGTLLYGIMVSPESALFQRFAMMPAAFGLGFVITNGITLSLANIKEGRGLASALLGSFSMLVSAIGTFLINVFNPTSLLPVAYAYLITGVIALFLLHFTKDFVNQGIEKA